MARGLRNSSEPGKTNKESELGEGIDRNASKQDVACLQVLVVLREQEEHVDPASKASENHGPHWNVEAVVASKFSLHVFLWISRVVHEKSVVDGYHTID